VTPSHARQAEIINFLGLDQLYQRWIGDLACLLADEAIAQPNRQAFSLWDFSGYNAVTTERVPPAGSPARMRWYNDPVHYTYRAGWAIVDRILGLSASEPSELSEFGEQVTVANVKQHFDKRQQGRQAYMDAQPEIRQEIEALYHGPQSKAAESSQTVAAACGSTLDR
jgi:hypothetical protein